MRFLPTKKGIEIVVEGENRLELLGELFKLEREHMLSTHDYVSTLTPEQVERCDKVRQLCKELEGFLIALPEHKQKTFSDRCISVSRTKLEEVCMFAIKAICFEGEEVR